MLFTELNAGVILEFGSYKDESV